MWKQMIILAFLFSFACSDQEERIEGTQPGDCTDGADNDADGKFDCNDDGCSGSPDCEESKGKTKKSKKSSAKVEGKSFYTSLDPGDCRMSEEGGDSAEWTCKRVGPYTPVVMALGGSDGFDQMNIDSRTPMSYLSLNVKGGKSVDFERKMSKYSLKGKKRIEVTFKKIEWRYESGKKDNPYALIFRVYTGKKSTLFVARLNKSKTCLIGVTSKNEEARKIADNLDLPCK
jgi:hypothetical protein